MPFEIEVEETGERLAVTSHPFALPDGRVLEMCVRIDDTDDISRGIASDRYGVPPHYRLLAALLPRPGRVLDLGAHVGTFAAYAAAAGHDVIAVEASARNVALLRRNLERNGLANVHVVHAAAAAEPGFAEFTEFGAYGVVSSPVLKWPTVRVPAIAVDRMLADLGWEGVDFVKMDIEGSEPMALRGMTRSLAGERGPHLVFEANGHTLNLYGESPASLLASLERAGYEILLIGDRQLVPVASSDLQGDCVVDYVALKPRPDRLDGWRVAAPMSVEKSIASAVRSASDPNPSVRGYIGRALRTAGALVRDDRRIGDAIAALARDSDPQVRDAVAWFRAGGARAD